MSHLKRVKLYSKSRRKCGATLQGFRFMILTDITKDACSELFDELKLVDF